MITIAVGLFIVVVMIAIARIAAVGLCVVLEVVIPGFGYRPDRERDDVPATIVHRTLPPPDPAIVRRLIARLPDPEPRPLRERVIMAKLRDTWRPSSS